jgi:hypothetical protein
MAKPLTRHNTLKAMPTRPTPHPTPNPNHPKKTPQRGTQARTGPTTQPPSTNTSRTNTSALYGWPKRKRHPYRADVGATQERRIPPMGDTPLNAEAGYLVHMPTLTAAGTTRTHPAPITLRPTPRSHSRPRHMTRPPACHTHQTAGRVPSHCVRGAASTHLDRCLPVDLDHVTVPSLTIHCQAHTVP